MRYDNRFDLSLGMAYDHMKAGANVLQGANLGGLDLSGSYWFSQALGPLKARAAPTWAAAAPAPRTLRLSTGRSSASTCLSPDPNGWDRTTSTARSSLTRMFGGAYFDAHLGNVSPQTENFYYNQMAPAAIIGGHMDLNRSAHWVFRITPDAVLTRYSTNYAPLLTQNDVNFAISVGVEYKFNKKR